MLSLSHKTYTNIIETLNSTSLNKGDVLNIDEDCFEQMVYKMYPKSSSYSRTSIARTPMARLPWLIRTHF